MSKPWTKCIHAEGTVYTKNLAQFCRDKGLDKSSVYGARKNTRGESTVHGWSFRVVDHPPPGAAIHEGGVYEGEARGFGEVMQAATPPPPEQPKAGGVDDIIAQYAEKDVSEMTPIEKYRALSTIIMEMSFRTATGQEDYPAGFKPKDLTAVLESYAKAWNIDPKKAMDMRTEADKISDSCEMILKDSSRIWEIENPTLEGIVRGMENIEKNATAYAEKLKGSGVRADSLLPAADLLKVDPLQQQGEPPSPKVIREAARCWIRRLRQVMHLASLAMNPYQEGMTRDQRLISESTHLLRFQLYVGRPDIESAIVYQFSHIHVRAAMRMWMARTGCAIHKTIGILQPGERDANGNLFVGERYLGTLIMMPPRHGKTDMVIFDITLSIDLRPRIQMAIIHDKESEASKVLRAAQNCFDPKTSQGRRNLRLFPERRLTDYDNNMTTLRVVNDDPPRNPNLMAASVWVSGQGNNLDRLYGDDLVPQSDMTEDNTREQRKARFSGTWMTRLQGKEWDVVLTGYPRHNQDLMWEYYTQAQLANETGGSEGMKMMALRLPVGGPKTNPAFKAIWPEMYPSSELRAKYNQLNDAALWAANYMLSPITSDQRIVETLRLYDPDDDLVQQFLRSATYHLSVDPAAKGDGTGDKAGVIVGALGSMVQVDFENGRELITEENMLLIVHAEEFYATQTQLTEHMLAMTSRYPIDTAHIEQVTGLGSAMAEALETHYGISRVVLHGTGNKGKASRLRAVAPMLEHSDPTIPAKVAFMGRRARSEDGEVDADAPLLIDPSMKRIHDYIVNFAVMSGFHSLDACTQLISHLVRGGDLAVHEGEFTRQLNKGQYRALSQKKAQALERALGDYAAEQDSEYAWFGAANNFV